MVFNKLFSWIKIEKNNKNKKTKLKQVIKYIEEHDHWQGSKYFLNTYIDTKDYSDLDNFIEIEVPIEVIQLFHKLGYESIYQAELLNKGKKQLLAVKMLSLIGTEASISVLLEVLASKETEISLTASEALQRIGIKDYFPILINLFYKSPVRTGEIILYFKEEGLKAVKEALRDASDEEKILLLELLGEFKEESILGTILKYLKDDNEEIRYQALLALTKTVNQSNEELNEYLLVALSDSYWKVRAEAAKCIGKLEIEAAKEKLIKLENDEAWTVQVAAKESLKNIS